jgi:predicted NUDIX family phosphoesterase
VDEEAARHRAQELLPEAKKVLDILRVGARRAYVLEVTGTPKAGKTSTLALIEGFFKRAGYSVYTLKERAADCPLPMKGHFFFNAWTTCTMLSEVLAKYDTDVDLIILDRGFFDALIWLGQQQSRGQVEAEEARIFTEFVLLDRWRRLVNLTVLVLADPLKAMEREQKGVLIRREGSLMNPDGLQAWNEHALQAAKEHAKRFNILKTDSSASTSAKETALGLLEQLLPRIREWGEKRIVVLPRQVVQQAFTVTDSEGKRVARPFVHGESAAAAWTQLQPHMKTCLRHEVEHDDAFVQIVGCGIVVHEESLFLLSRSSEDEKSTYGRTVLWKGCHIEAEQAPSLDAVASDVTERVLEEFHLRTELETEFLGMAWTEDPALVAKTESRHLGVFFLATLADKSVARSMQDKEFRKAGRGHVMTGKFQTRDQIIRSVDELELEVWSRFAVENIGLQKPG